MQKSPEGMCELMFEDCNKRKAAENMFSKLFELCCYSPVITPTLEYFDLFNDTDGLKQEQLYTLVDSNGKLLVLRPDSTKPLARLLSERIKILPQRLYYIQPVFIRNAAQKRRKNEIMQVGAELIGLDGKNADLEIICLALEALLMFCGEFVFEISHAKLFCEKNVEKLFGGKEVFLEAEKYFTNEESKIILQELKSTYETLVRLFPIVNISVDFALKNELEYYTGIIFKAYHTGGEILSGGRYDNLYGSFGKTENAIGFAADLDLLANFLPVTEKTKTEFCSTGDFEKDYIAARESRQKLIKSVK